MSEIADYSGIEKLRARILTRKRIWREYFMTCFSETDKTINGIWKAQAATFGWLRQIDCKHEEQQRVKFVTMDNREVHRMQCLNCGWMGNQIKKDDGIWPLYLDVYLMMGDIFDELREYARGMETAARDTQAGDWFDQYSLTSICHPCHLKITEADRDRRKS
jgi:hypothetical protein